MSYYYGISVFDDIIKKTDIYDKCYTFINEMYHNHFSEVIKNRVGYFPHIEKHLISDKPITTSDLTRDEIQYCSELFDFAFIYWEKFNLLGVYYSDDIDYLKYLEFFNGSDQDVEYDKWNTLLKDDPSRQIFADIINKTKSGENDEDVKKYFSDWDDDDLDIEYLRRSYAYKKIEELLLVDPYGDTRNATEFKMSPKITNHAAIIKEVVNQINKMRDDVHA